MFRATKGSGVTITTILRNNAIETRPGNKIHHLGEKRSACVHCAPDWKTRIGEDVTSRILDRVQGVTKNNTSETLVLQRYAEIVRSVNRTAVVRKVVWEGRSRVAPPYPDLWDGPAVLQTCQWARLGERAPKAKEHAM